MSNQDWALDTITGTVKEAVKDLNKSGENIATEILDLNVEIEEAKDQIESSIDNEIEILEVPLEEMVVIKQEHLEVICDYDDARVKTLISGRLKIFKDRLNDSTIEFLSVLIGSDLQIISQMIYDGRNLYNKDINVDSGFVDILGILDNYEKLLNESGKNPPIMLYNPETRQPEYVGNLETKVPYTAKELIESVKAQAESKK